MKEKQAGEQEVRRQAMGANSRTSFLSPCCSVVARVGAVKGKPGEGTVFTHAIFGEH